MNRILLLRHGETEGESSIRYHGANDVALSELGRSQMRLAASALPDEAIDLVVASPLARAWEGARIVQPGAPVVLEADFREIDFGDWEGLTAEEIEQRDPERYREWREQPEGFHFPGGESRRDFRARVVRGAGGLLQRRAASPLVVAHHGVIRAIVEHLCGAPPPEGTPELGGLLQVARAAGGGWRFRGPATARVR